MSSSTFTKPKSRKLEDYSDDDEENLDLVGVSDCENFCQSQNIRPSPKKKSKTEDPEARNHLQELELIERTDDDFIDVDDDKCVEKKDEDWMTQVAWDPPEMHAIKNIPVPETVKQVSPAINMAEMARRRRQTLVTSPVTKLKLEKDLLVRGLRATNTKLGWKRPNPNKKRLFPALMASKLAKCSSSLIPMQLTVTKCKKLNPTQITVPLGTLKPKIQFLPRPIDASSPETSDDEEEFKGEMLMDVADDELLLICSQEVEASLTEQKQRSKLKQQRTPQSKGVAISKPVNKPGPSSSKRSSNHKTCPGSNPSPIRYTRVHQELSIGLVKRKLQLGDAVDPASTSTAAITTTTITSSTVFPTPEDSPEGKEPMHQAVNASCRKLEAKSASNSSWEDDDDADDEFLSQVAMEVEIPEAEAEEKSSSASNSCMTAGVSSSKSYSTLPRTSSSCFEDEDEDADELLGTMCLC